ncbi:MAG: hypothetical protein FJZ64_00460 [Chlamydiae bacterium]|nr:hypothetical protein [Chlamydiota bacterium]
MPLTINKITSVDQCTIGNLTQIKTALETRITKLRSQDILRSKDILRCQELLQCIDFFIEQHGAGIFPEDVGVISEAAAYAGLRIRKISEIAREVVSGSTPPSSSSPPITT